MVGAPAATVPTSSRGLATATIVLFWVTAGAMALMVIALLVRRAAWADFADGGGFSAAADVSDADDFVQAANFIAFLAALATVIVLSIWSLRVGRRAKALGVNVSPGLLCGSWYIPYASAIVPFIQLRRIATHRGVARGMLNLWQGLLIASWVLATAVAGLEPDEDDVFDDVGDISDRLNSQAGVSVLAALVLFAMAFAAMRAVRTVDDACSAPAH